jgi:drug/metabolite transporter (DMT)-like permease
MRREAGTIGRGGAWRVVAAFAAIYVVWGSTYLAVKIVVHASPPLLAAGVRFLLAGAALYAWARVRGAPAPTRQQWGALALLGALIFPPGYSALFWAEQTIPSGLAAVLVATLPLWTLCLEVAVFRTRRATWRQGIAIALGFLGVVLLSGGTALHTPGAWLPCVALVVCEIGWALGSILMRRLPLPASSIVSAGGQMVIGGAILLIGSASLGEWRHLTTPTPAAVAAMAYLVVAGSMIAFSAYVWLLGRASPSRLASFTYVNPLVALLIGWVGGGEALPARALSGAAFVIASVVLVRGGKTQERSTAKPLPRTSASTARALQPQQR